MRLNGQVQQLSILCAERNSTENLCVVGEFYCVNSTNNQYVQKLTESWREMALAIGDLDVHAKLCVVDVRLNEIFFHKNYLS